jgi:hypothetical protein
LQFIEKRAVAFDEITSNLLKARKQAISQQSSKRRFVTADGCSATLIEAIAVTNGGMIWIFCC